MAFVITDKAVGLKLDDVLAQRIGRFPIKQPPPQPTGVELPVCPGGKLDPTQATSPTTWAPLYDSSTSPENRKFYLPQYQVVDGAAGVTLSKSPAPGVPSSVGYLQIDLTWTVPTAPAGITLS